MQHNLKNYKAFRQIVKQCKLEVKGEAIIMVAALFQWFDSLESKMVEMDKVEIKPIEDKK